MIRSVAAACVAILLGLGSIDLRAGEPSPALTLAQQLNDAFIEVAEKVSPSVVVIKVAQQDSGFDLSDDSPFWEMVPKEFRERMQEEREKRRGERSQRRHPPIYNGQGSGVILRDDGYIMTNFHVIEDAEKIQVRLRDGRTFTATVRGTDPQSDIAVLKIDATNLPAAKLGNSMAVRVGEFTVAIGAPFDLDYSVTYGHVSGKGRSHVIPAFGMNSQGASMDQDFIQTDASINPGNSGGPLVNLYGEVIGINTLIRGLSTGIGFAVPINLARDVANKLIAEGKFVRTWLGIGIRALSDDEDYRNLGHGLTNGVIVTEIRPEGPASKSDLRAGDIITSVDSQPVATENQLRNAVRTKSAGTNVSLAVVRLDDKHRPRNLKVLVRPEPWPERPVQISRRTQDSEPASAEVGLKAQEITRELADQYKLVETNGVVITEVSEEGLAQGKVRTGDVITGVNHREISSLKEFEEAMGKTDVKRGVLLDITTGKVKRRVVLRDAE